MKVLELFAGSRSIGKVCDEMNIRCFSSDWTPFDGIDYAVDILKFDMDKVPFIPDVIWASPPCTTFSVASIGKHWTPDKQPKTHEAMVGLEILQKTISIIQSYQYYNPNLIWYIENPRGMMRKMDVAWDYMNHVRHTVTYCQYGDTRMKPTDIWTNNYDWQPRPACKNGDTCHVSAPRGSRTGTQGLKGSYLRSQVPKELCQEIIQSSKKLYFLWNNPKTSSTN